MQIAQTSTSNNVSQALLDSVNGASSTSSATSTTEETQNRFMTLLVTQMRNQDPLNPMDNAQVTSQMAQLSTVTGIDKLNTTLESLISSVQASQSYQASSMIGHSVLVQGDTVSTDGTGGFFGVELPVGADKLDITIKDSAGSTVRTLNLGGQSAGSIPISWDGYTNDGAIATNGNYQIEVNATVSGQAVESTALSYAQVLSVTNASGGVKLNLSNAASVNTSDVKEIF
jgi:flagellar basal-body rod modification protein FlgD